MKKKAKKTESLASLRKKLYSALAMLLISSIMMVSSSYAWLVLSTAPEVTGITTQVGANGSLEIALLNTESYMDITKVTEADIDESATSTSQISNLSWGNLVDLGNSSYGLSEIVLNPSRLNIAQSGTNSAGDTQYKVNDILLKTPVYGEDGRITGLEKAAISTIYGESKTFAYTDIQEYGVRAIGTSASMNAFQLGMNSARSALVTNTSSARTAASTALNETGSALGNIAVAYALSSSEAEYTRDDVQALLDLAEGMQVSLDYIDTALRQVFVGYICTEEAQVSSDNYTDIKEFIEDKDVSLSSLEEKYPGVTGVHDYIVKLETNQSNVETAIGKCETLLNSESSSYTQDEILDVMLPLVDYTQMTLGGKTIDEVKNMSFDQLFELVMSSGGLTVSVPTGSGLLSDIADFAGDYTAKATVDEIVYKGNPLTNVTVTIATATTYNPTHLSACGSILKGYTAGSNDDAGTVITDYYGYALDLAFRTNAVESNLLLQTDSVQRIYEDSDSAATQGGGSYMQFTSNAGLSATKMIKLMGAIRVVFVDEEQTVLAIAALDTTLGQDVYELLDEAEQTSTGKYAVLDAKVKQNSDYITASAHNALPATSVVQIDSDTGAIKAPLYLYDFSMTESKLSAEDDTDANVSTAADGDTNTEGDTDTEDDTDTDSDTGTDTETETTTKKRYTGGITLGSKRTSSAITALEENVPRQVTAIVYLDGSFVTNAMVAADSTYSMTGVLNLQFASDANLMPMNNQKLMDGDSEENGSVEEEEPENSDSEEDDSENNTDENQGTDETGGES